MTPSEIIADVLKEFWAAPKLSNAIMARLAAEGYAITHASPVTVESDIPTVILGGGTITLEPIVREDRMVAGILFKQMTAAQGINERVSMETLAQAKPVLQIISTKPQSFIALADVCDQAIRLFSPVAGKGLVSTTDTIQKAVCDV